MEVQRLCQASLQSDSALVAPQVGLATQQLGCMEEMRRRGDKERGDGGEETRKTQDVLNDYTPRNPPRVYAHLSISWMYFTDHVLGNPRASVE